MYRSHTVVTSKSPVNLKFHYTVVVYRSAIGHIFRFSIESTVKNCVQMSLGFFTNISYSYDLFYGKVCRIYRAETFRHLSTQ